MGFVFENQILVFSDGAAKGNPGPGGWGVVVVKPEGQITELGGAGAKVTNNQMEMLGVIEGLKSIRRIEADVAVLTDSAYVLHGITSWIFGWMKRGWKNASGQPVANQSYWQQMHELVMERKNLGAVSWHYVPGHAGVPGNERVDEIASNMALKKRIELYEGPLIEYDVAVYDIPDDTSIPEMKNDRTKSAKKAAHSYLSLVNGELQIHKTWKECEARVKGRSGAKFKKASSPEDEVQIKKSWGLT